MGQYCLHWTLLPLDITSNEPVVGVNGHYRLSSFRAESANL